MHIRKIPENVFSAMNINDGFNYLWNPQISSSILGLGYSYYFEFIEYFAERINRIYSGLILDKNLVSDNDIFMKQEWQHALAHKPLNEFIASVSPPSKEKYHGNVYDFMYINYKLYYEPILHDILSNDLITLDNASLKHGIKEVAIFESKTCVSSFVFFEQLFDGGNIKRILSLSNNLGILYLLAYHFVEEMEHSYVALDLYEELYHEKLWDKSLVESEITNQSIENNQAVQYGLYAAKLLGVNISVKDIECSSYYKFTIERQKYFINENFHPRLPSVSEKREYYINQWDDIWEPMVLDAINTKVATAR
ncbi:metal-dependent hydrolase [Erwinia endophytica]|uniref:metal-dependent hydrolase n=1 Tax=Erwinia endophytica TaxID=1563158 RepID=UPI00186B6772|nr:metal-dependent hydrolase [Erwinia endophytica]